MTDDNKLFLLRGDWREANHHTTGRLPDGRQVLIGWEYEGVLFLWFSASGKFLRAEPVEVSVEAGNQRPEERLMGAAHRYVEDWRTANDFVQGPIRVSFFYIRDPFVVTVRMLRQGALDLLCDPYSSWLHHDIRVQLL